MADVLHDPYPSEYTTNTQKRFNLQQINKNSGLSSTSGSASGSTSGSASGSVLGYIPEQIASIAPGQVCASKK